MLRVPGWLRLFALLRTPFGSHFGCAMLNLVEVKESKANSKFSIDNVENFHM